MLNILQFKNIRSNFHFQNYERKNKNIFFQIIGSPNPRHLLTFDEKLSISKPNLVNSLPYFRSFSYFYYLVYTITLILIN